MVNHVLRNRKQIRNFGWFVFGPAINSALGFISIPIITRFVVPAEYAVFSYYLLIQTLLNLLVHAGFDQSYVREFHIEKGDTKLIAHSVFLPLLVCTIFFTVGCIFRMAFSVWLFGTQESTAFVSLLVSNYLLVFSTFSLLNLRMNEKAMLFSLIQTMNKLTVFFISILFVTNGRNSYTYLVYANTIGLLVQAVLALLFTWRSWKIIWRFDIKRLYSLAVFAIPLLPSTLMFWVLDSYDKIALKTMVSNYEYGLYAGASKLVLVLGVIKTGFSNFWVPKAYQWNSVGIDKRKYCEVSDFIQIVTTFVFICIVVFRKLIVGMLGVEYRSTYNILPLLALAFVYYLQTEVTGLGISFSRKTKYTLLSTFIAGIVQFVLSKSIIPLWGITGAALSSALSYLVYFVVKTLYSQRLWGDISFINNIYVACIMFSVGIFVAVNMPIGIVGSLVALVIMQLKSISNYFSFYRRGL